MKMAPISLLLLFLFPFSTAVQFPHGEAGAFPVVVSTWPFVEAVKAAWAAAASGVPAIDAVVAGCSACEELRCDGTVGPGGSPDENGETTIDALLMNGTTMEVGAVAAMRYVKDGIKAAKLVMEYTEHTLLVGEQASMFAISMGLPGPSNLSSVESLNKWNKWKENSCEPNFRKNVIPKSGCGPYHPKTMLSKMLPSFDLECPGERSLSDVSTRESSFSPTNHDTISMAVIDRDRRIAVGTSTNGATFKIPGRSRMLDLHGGVESGAPAEEAAKELVEKF